MQIVSALARVRVGGEKEKEGIKMTGYDHDFESLSPNLLLFTQPTWSWTAWVLGASWQVRGAQVGSSGHLFPSSTGAPLTLSTLLMFSNVSSLLQPFSPRPVCFRVYGVIVECLLLFVGLFYPLVLVL